MRATREVAIYLRAVNRMDQGLNSSSSSIKRFIDSSISLFKGLATVIGGVFAAMTSFATYVGAEFEQALANTSSMFITAAQSAEQMQGWMDKLEETARSLGATTAFTATEAANAMYSLASGGLNAKEVMEATQSVLHLAGATLSGMSEAAELTMGTLRQFNLQAQESARITNVFAAAIQNSMLTMNRLHFSMQYVGPVAARLGMTVEETAGALAILHNAGLKGSLAGTGMRQVLIRLIRPNAELARALEGTTVTADGFAAVLERLKEAHLRPDEAARMFGQRTLAALSALLSAGKTGFDAMTEAVTDTTAASDAYALQMNTVRSQWILLMSAVQEVGISIFKVLRDDIMVVLKFLQRFVQASKPLIVGLYKDLRDAIRSAAPAMAKFIQNVVYGFQLAWRAVTLAWDAFVKWFNSMGGLSEMLARLGNAIVIVAENIMPLVVGFGMLAALVAVLSGNWGLLLLGGAFLIVADDMNESLKSGQSFTDWMQETIWGARDLGTYVSRFAFILVEFVSSLVLSYPAFFLGVSAFVIESLGWLGKTLSNFWDLAKRVVIEGMSWDEAWDKLKGDVETNSEVWKAKIQQGFGDAFTWDDKWMEPWRKSIDDFQQATENSRIRHKWRDTAEDAERIRDTFADITKFTFDFPEMQTFKTPEWDLGDMPDFFTGFSNAFEVESGFIKDHWITLLQQMEDIYYGSWDIIWDTTRTGTEKWKAIWDDAFSALGKAFLQFMWSLKFDQGLVEEWKAWRGRVKAEKLVMAAKEEAGETAIVSVGAAERMAIREIEQTQMHTNYVETLAWQNDKLNNETAAVLAAEAEKTGFTQAGEAARFEIESFYRALKGTSNTSEVTQHSVGEGTKTASTVASMKARVAASEFETTMVVSNLAAQDLARNKNTATTNVNTVAEEQNAIMKFFSAHAWIPFVGLGLALAAITVLKSFHTGGLIGGPSATAGDTSEQLFLGQKGEFVMPAAQTRRNLPLLEAMRDGRAPTFSAVGAGGGSPVTAAGPQVTVNIPAGSLLIANDDLSVRRLAEKIREEIDYKISRTFKE